MFHIILHIILRIARSGKSGKGTAAVDTQVSRLQQMDDQALLNVVKNTEAGGPNEYLRVKAILLLKQRGVRDTALDHYWKYANRQFVDPPVHIQRFRKYALIALPLFLAIYVIVIISDFDFAIIPNHGEYNDTCEIACLLVFFVFWLLALLERKKFYNNIGEKVEISEIIVAMLFCAFMYPIVLIQSWNQMPKAYDDFDKKMHGRNW